MLYLIFPFYSIPIIFCPCHHWSYTANSQASFDFFHLPFLTLTFVLSNLSWPGNLTLRRVLIRYWLHCRQDMYVMVIFTFNIRLSSFRYSGFWACSVWWPCLLTYRFQRPTLKRKASALESSLASPKKIEWVDRLLQRDQAEFHQYQKRSRCRH